MNRAIRTAPYVNLHDLKPVASGEDGFNSLIKGCTKATQSGEEFDSRIFRNALLRLTAEKPSSISSILTVVARWNGLLKNDGIAAKAVPRSVYRPIT